MFNSCTLHSQALAKRQMFDDQASSSIVWWSNILPFGQLFWWYLMLFELHQTFDQTTSNISIVLMFNLFGDVWFVWPGVSNMGVSNMFDSQIPPCWNCCDTLGSFVAHNSLRSDVWRCLIKHVWTVWPGLETSKCLITKQYLMMFGRQTFPV